MREYCNPLNLDYKFQHYGKVAAREAADPTLIYFKGRYYLFASMSAGFYHSTNLVDWTWHENRDVELYGYAPDVRQIGNYMYFCASSRKMSTIWRTKDPLSDTFEKVSEPFAFWDPNIFYDEDTGKTYLYWGCGNDPLYGIELDTRTMRPIGKKVKIMESDIASHGWERKFAEHLEQPEKVGFLIKYVEPLVNPRRLPYIEGSYMNKWNGKYYFQYSAPGTEMAVYADGVYVSDAAPLTSFAYQKHNPFSFVPTGFITGAGHGSTIEDEYGNLWHAATMRVSVNQTFERRVGLFPAGVDEDGILFCNQNFASYPLVIPEGKFDPGELQPHYMLLSYKKQAKASSSKPGYGVELALNENIRNWWCADGSQGQWYQADLGKIYNCHSIQLNLADVEIPVRKYPKKERAKEISANYRYIDSSKALHTRYLMEGSADGSSWCVIRDAGTVDTDRTHDYIVLPENSRFRYIRVTAIELAYGQDFAISGLRVFGLDDEGVKAAPSTGVTAVMEGHVDAFVRWNQVENAMGYNVRYGIAPNKLYNSCLVYENTEVYLTTLNKGVEYWCCVDSFNESGITEGQTIRIEPMSEEEELL